MSVVNQMLMELERRGALQEGDGPGPGVHAVQPPRPLAGVRLPVVALLVTAAAAAAWTAAVGWRGGTEAPSSPMSRGGVRAIQPLAPAQPPTADVSDGGERMGVRPSPIPAPAPRPAREPERTPAEAAPAAQKPAGKPVPATAKVAAAATAMPPEVPSEGREAPALAPSIDKKPRQLTPQQQAENEFARAASLVRQGRIHEAVEGLRGVLQLHPGSVPARQMLAALLVESRRAGEAEQVLQEGLAANPQEPRLALVLARLQAERGEFQPALETLQAAAPAAANDADFQGLMGTMQQRLSRHGEAVAHYLAAARLAPQAGVWWMGLGISLQAEGRVADAREAYQRARATNSLSPELVAFVDQRLARLAGGR